jgi:small subunit ribosomal protein S16
MKMMGRKHRPYFRICAVDGRNPRDGRVLEELGTYDPMVADTDARALLKAERIDYWLGVGAQPSQRVRVLIKKYGSSGTHAAAQQAARERLAMPRVVPDAGEPVYVRPTESEVEATAASAPAKAGESSAAESSVADAGEATAGDDSSEKAASVSE